MEYERDDRCAITYAERSQIFWITVFALTALAGFFILGVRFAKAQELGRGIVCDTQAQLEEYFDLTSAGVDQPVAIQTVNEGAKATACVYAIVVYARGDKKARIHSPSGEIDIVEITVLIVHSKGQWLHIDPTIQYTGFYVEGEKGA